MTANELAATPDDPSAASAAYRATARAWRATDEGRRRWWPAPEGDCGMTWDGVARMAAARLAAGVDLDDRDREALRRHPAAARPEETSGAA